MWSYSGTVQYLRLNFIAIRNNAKTDKFPPSSKFDYSIKSRLQPCRIILANEYWKFEIRLNPCIWNFLPIFTATRTIIYVTSSFLITRVIINWNSRGFEHIMACQKGKGLQWLADAERHLFSTHKSQILGAICL